VIQESLLSQIVQSIEKTTGQPFDLLHYTSVQGGNINRSYKLIGQTQSYFIKLNQASLLNMFHAEAMGLQALSNAKVFRVPEVITSGVADDSAFLILDSIELESLQAGNHKLLGQKLARLHQEKQPYFGWPMNNFIGHTVQINTASEDWCVFWREQRLAFQLNTALQQGYDGRLQSLGRDVCKKIPEFFRHYQPQASLLHGDLWAGNISFDKHGVPVVYDPACYYGDREADIAMTELFGGFNADFYTAYNAVWPLDIGYQQRKLLYNLYHILNHLNLFGLGYLGQAEQLMENVLDTE